MDASSSARPEGVMAIEFDWRDPMEVILKEDVAKLGARGDVVNAGAPERGESWAVRFAVVDACQTMRAVQEIDGVHAIDTDEENVFDI